MSITTKPGCSYKRYILKEDARELHGHVLFNRRFGNAEIGAEKGSTRKKGSPRQVNQVLPLLSIPSGINPSIFMYVIACVLDA